MKRFLGGLLLLVSVIGSWGLQAAQSAAAQNQEEVVVAYQDAPLIQAVLNGDVDTVACLLADPSVDVNARNSQGRTAFMLLPFARQNHIQMADLFLASDRVDVNAQDNEGYTALMFIVWYRGDLAVNLVGNMRIDLSIRDNYGRTMNDLAQIQAQRYEEVRRRQAVAQAMQAEQEARALRAIEREARNLARANKENNAPARRRRTDDR